MRTLVLILALFVRGIIRTLFSVVKVYLFGEWGRLLEVNSNQNAYSVDSTR